MTRTRETGSEHDRPGESRWNAREPEIHRRLVTFDDPRGVAVDAGHVYWANFGLNTIGRANLDGTGIDQSFITGADFPFAVAVDVGDVIGRTSA